MTIFPDIDNCKIAVIGLGYVGLPLAIEFSKSDNEDPCLQRTVIGYDVNSDRITELEKGIDRTNELGDQDKKYLRRIHLTDDSELLKTAEVFIVTVPTPIDKANRPDFSYLINASKLVGSVLAKKRAGGEFKYLPIVIFESTVYPGATEEVCVNTIEEVSGLVHNSMNIGEGFVSGYSPERVNPGDHGRRLADITKITSGSNKESASWIDNLYKSIIRAGTHLASSIKVAEAAKVIENTQRDLNIALVNEIAIICNLLKIDTLDVLEAAKTKWNFLPFKPGLVGGHCIGVDPYYLTDKAEQHGYHPQVVLAGRRINDSMAGWIVDRIILDLANRRMAIVGSKALVLGLTFKEDCPDLRNSKVFDVVYGLERYGIEVSIYDPWISSTDLDADSPLNTVSSPVDCRYDVVILAVAHSAFRSLEPSDYLEMVSDSGFIFDIKGIVPRMEQVVRI